MRNFIKRKENFECGKCEEKVWGDGYTDHCPKCLWGKHVDENIPGDRKSRCGGMMEPLKSVFEKGKFRIFYRCIKCGYDFRVREGKTDDREKLVELAKRD